MKCKIIGRIVNKDETIGYKIVDDSGECKDIDIRTAEAYIKNGTIINAIVSHSNIRISTFDTAKLPIFKSDGSGFASNSIVILYAIESGFVYIGFSVLLPMGVIKLISSDTLVSLHNQGYKILNAGVDGNQVYPTQGFAIKKGVYKDGKLVIMTKEELSRSRAAKAEYDNKFKVDKRGVLISVSPDILKLDKIVIPSQVAYIEPGVLNKAQCKEIVIPETVCYVSSEPNVFNMGVLRKVHANEYWKEVFYSPHYWTDLCIEINYEYYLRSDYDKVCKLPKDKLSSLFKKYHVEDIKSLMSYICKSIDAEDLYKYNLIEFIDTGMPF